MKIGPPRESSTFGVSGVLASLRTVAAVIRPPLQFKLMLRSQRPGAGKSRRPLEPYHERNLGGFALEAGDANVGRTYNVAAARRFLSLQS